jgi:hypothetical protein
MAKVSSNVTALGAQWSDLANVSMSCPPCPRFSLTSVCCRCGRLALPKQTVPRRRLREEELIGRRGVYYQHSSPSNIVQTALAVDVVVAPKMDSIAGLAPSWGNPGVGTRKCGGSVAGLTASRGG